MRDAYAILKVPRNASREQIVRARNRLAKEIHPDTNHDDPRATERFEELQAAFEQLEELHRLKKTVSGESAGGAEPASTTSLRTVNSRRRAQGLDELDSLPLTPFNSYGRPQDPDAETRALNERDLHDAQAKAAAAEQRAATAERDLSLAMAARDRARSDHKAAIKALETAMKQKPAASAGQGQAKTAAGRGKLRDQRQNDDTALSILV